MMETFNIGGTIGKEAVHAATVDAVKAATKDGIAAGIKESMKEGLISATKENIRKTTQAVIEAEAKVAAADATKEAARMAGRGLEEAATAFNNANRELEKAIGERALAEATHEAVQKVVKEMAGELEQTVKTTVGTVGKDIKSIAKNIGNVIRKNPIKAGLFGAGVGVMLASSILYGVNNGAILLVTDKSTVSSTTLEGASFQAFTDAQNGNQPHTNMVNVQITYKTQKKLATDSNAVARTNDTVGFNNIEGNKDTWLVTQKNDKTMILSMTNADYALIVNNKTELVLQTTFENQLQAASTAAGNAVGTVGGAAGDAAGKAAGGLGKGVGAGAAGFMSGLGNGLGLGTGSGGIFSMIYNNISAFVGILCCIIMMVIFYDMYEVVA